MPVNSDDRALIYPSYTCSLNKTVFSNQTEPTDAYKYRSSRMQNISGIEIILNKVKIIYI